MNTQEKNIMESDNNDVYLFCSISLHYSKLWPNILDTTNTSMIGISLTQSNKTINGVEYIVWTGRGIGRLMGYLIKK